MEKPVEIENTRADLDSIHPSLRADYGDGMPLRTFRASGGVTVRFFGSHLPDTVEENRKRLRHAYDVAESIISRAARRGEL